MPDEGEHEWDTCSADSGTTDSSGDSDRGREALNEEVHRPRTNLLSLPPELHYEIFKHLEEDKAGKRPICRALWPMARRNTFRDVCLMTPVRLQRFAGLMRPVHHMYRDASLLQEVRKTGRLIQALTIFVRPPKPRRRSSTDSSADDDSPADVPVMPDVKPGPADRTDSSHVRAVLAHATRVKRLTVIGPRALGYLVPAKSGFRWLRELEQLTLEVCGGSVQHWNAGHLSRLRRFRRLKELHLDLSNLGNFAAQPTASQTTTLKPIQQIHQLHLRLEDSIVPAEIARCVALFSGLRKFVIDLDVVDDFDDAGREDGLIGLGDLLQAVPASRLSHLVIDVPYVYEMFPEDVPWPGLTIEADLARFHRLTRLSLCYNTFHRAGELFDILAAHVPRLQSLTLGRFAYVRAAKLLSFVRQRGGPSRALKELECDIFDGYVDASAIPSRMPERSDVIDGTFELDEWWELPLWQSDFTFAQAQELVTAGQEVGVRITGTLPGAIRTETARVREQAFLDERRDEYLYDLSSLFGSE
jgi:hypothetical protein